MMHPSDTPPNGDFARYVERLTASNAEAPATGREDMRKPRKAVQAAMLSSPAVPQPLTGTAWLKHLKWLVAAWIGTQLLASFVSWGEFLFIPILLGYAAWLMVHISRSASGVLSSRLREVAAQLAQEVKKAQSTHSSNKQ